MDLFFLGGLMMKVSNEILHRLLFILFTALLLICSFKASIITVHAVSDSDVDNAASVMAKYDGISNWKLKSSSSDTLVSNDYGTIPIGGNFSLGYSFGSARNVNNNVHSGDMSITKKSTTATVDSAPTINNSKINIFLDYGGKYYGILHQGANSYIGTDGTPEKASDTSIDFALLTGNASSNYYSGMNLLVKAENKLYYTGTDTNGNKVFKIAGYYPTRSVFFEILLRPSITGAPVVSRELYVYNASTNANDKKQFQTFYGEDTGLNPNGSDTSVDNVPMFAIGGGQGLYLMSGANYTPASKLFITNNLDDGFKDFMGRVLTNPTDWSVKGRFHASSADISNPKLPWATNPTSTQNGDTDATAGQNLLKSKNTQGTMQDLVNSDGKQDSAYVLRWPATDLGPTQVAHFASNIGATIKGYAVPTVKKTYKNITSPTGTGNHVGDTLRFTLKVRNDGYDSHWNITNITDNIPKGLTVTSVPNSAWLNNGNINFNPGVALADGVEKTFTFDAKINNLAPYNLTNGYLTNTATFTGENLGQTDSRTLKDSVNIPIEIPALKYRFTKTVRNESNGETSYVSKTNAKENNILDYQVKFSSNGTASLTKATFVDNLPNGVELIPDSITLNGSKVNATSLNFDVGPLNNGDNFILFKARVTAVDAMTASNTAYLNNITTTGTNDPTSVATEEPAIVNIEAAPNTISFDKVPTTIDFGSINTTGSDRILPNISTIGQLIVTHTEKSAFQVGVSYDNDGETPISTKNTDHTINEKLIQDGGESLYFNQHNNSDSEDHWYPLSDAPTYINNTGFSGSSNYDLTNYIGLKKWRLRVPANTNAGAYSGTITWSIIDTP